MGRSTLKRFILICISAAISAAVSILSANSVYAGQWIKDNQGWRWQNDDGSYPTDSWLWLDGDYDGMSEHYYFGPDGYMMAGGTAPDGQSVNEDGAWMIDGIVQREETAGADNRSWQIVMSGDEYNQFMDMAGRINEGIGREEENEDSGRSDVECGDGNYGDMNCGNRKADGKQAGNDEENHITDENQVAARIADLTNEERKKHGKSELPVDNELAENAAIRAKEAGMYYNHTRPDKSKFDTAITVKRYSSAENLAKLYHREEKETTAQAAISGWLDSSGHKKNMLDSRWTETGVGVWEGEGYIFIAQLFIRN